MYVADQGGVSDGKRKDCLVAVTINVDGLTCWYGLANEKGKE